MAGGANDAGSSCRKQLGFVAEKSTRRIAGRFCHAALLSAGRADAARQRGVDPGNAVCDIRFGILDRPFRK